ncbi:unnamed protein product [Dovyalis caffra]|uniref:Uncharacterized protein n=1 Tax=Dovyalis caffra TaxID=77055 RepID=A0AAV1RHB7_9ROSI|nr:unnamed protein product [Dovyalis caffra]
MGYKRFLVIVLGLLYVMNAIWGSYAHDHQDWEMNKYELAGTREIGVPARNELLNVFSAASTRKMGLGGRKMAARKVLRREIEKEQVLHGGASEDNSGANYSNVKCDFQVKGSDFNVRCKHGDKRKSPKMIKGPGFVAFGKENKALHKSIGGSQDQLNNQLKDMNNLERKTLSVRLGTPRTETVHLPKSNSKDSKALPTKTSLESPSRADIDQEHQGSATDPKDGTQRLIDATREIVNLMHKDYSTHDRPRRNPPIHNKVPIH